MKDEPIYYTYGNQHQKVETLLFKNFHNEGFRSVSHLRYPASVELSPAIVPVSNSSPLSGVAPLTNYCHCVTFIADWIAMTTGKMEFTADDGLWFVRIVVTLSDGLISDLYLVKSVRLECLKVMSSYENIWSGFLKTSDMLCHWLFSVQYTRILYGNTEWTMIGLQVNYLYASNEYWQPVSLIWIFFCEF